MPFEMLKKRWTVGLFMSTLQFSLQWQQRTLKHWRKQTRIWLVGQNVWKGFADRLAWLLPRTISHNDNLSVSLSHQWRGFMTVRTAASWRTLTTPSSTQLRAMMFFNPASSCYHPSPKTNPCPALIGQRSAVARQHSDTYLQYSSTLAPFPSSGWLKQTAALQKPRPYLSSSLYVIELVLWHHSFFYVLFIIVMEINQ